MTDALTNAQKRHRQMTTGEVKPEHGTYSTYVNYLCRCEPCRKANREYHRSRAAKLRSQETAKPEPVKDIPDLMQDLEDSLRAAQEVSS